MKIRDFFDAGYYINLDRRLDRNEHISNLLKDTDLYDFFERVSGEDGINEPDPMLKHRYCAASHKKVFNMAEERNHNTFVIFEDDFVFYNCENYNGIDIIEQGLEQLKDIQDWDIIYFGGYIFDESIKKVTANLVKATTVLTTHGYGISKKGLSKLIKHRPFEDSAIDGWIGNNKEIIKYVIYPMASYQLESPSDLDTWSRTPPLKHWEYHYITPDKIIE
jgi:GR25 family glycosyltransferase involved in LPS biosynthesis